MLRRRQRRLARIRCRGPRAPPTPLPAPSACARRTPRRSRRSGDRSGHDDPRPSRDPSRLHPPRCRPAPNCRSIHRRCPRTRSKRPQATYPPGVRLSRPSLATPPSGPWLESCWMLVPTGPTVARKTVRAAAASAEVPARQAPAPPPGSTGRRFRPIRTRASRPSTAAPPRRTRCLGNRSQGCPVTPTTGSPSIRTTATSYPTAVTGCWMAATTAAAAVAWAPGWCSRSRPPAQRPPRTPSIRRNSAS